MTSLKLPPSGTHETSEQAELHRPWPRNYIHQAQTVSNDPKMGHALARDRITYALSLIQIVRI